MVVPVRVTEGVFDAVAINVVVVVTEGVAVGDGVRLIQSKVLIALLPVSAI